MRFFGFLFMFFYAIVFGQSRNTLSVKQQRNTFEKKQLWIPAGAMASSVAIEWARNPVVKKGSLAGGKEVLALYGSAEDFLQFVPYVATYGLEWIGMQPKTDWKNRTVIIAKGSLLNFSLTLGMKYLFANERPDGTQYSFPSGHTANAFVGATFLSMEYGEHYPWIPYVAYGMASMVGGMRIYHQRHRLSDVLFGAGIGILSSKIAYWTHQYKWNSRKTDKDPMTVLYQNNEQFEN